MTTQTSEPFGIGIIGAGGILTRHALAFLGVPDLARLVGVADIDLARAEAARRRYGMQMAAADYRELLDNPAVDVVSICTRPDTHARIVADAVRAGKHVLCEKPIARTLAEADELIDLCERHPESRVACLYQWRTDPAVRFVRALVEEGAIGRPLMAEAILRTFRSDAYYQGPVARESWKLDGGGVAMVVGIHQLDLLLFLLGDPVEVSAQMDRFVRPTEGEDALVGCIRFASGAIATVRFSALDHRDVFEVEILGRKAGAHIRGGGPACEWSIEARDTALARALRGRGRREAPAGSRLEPSVRQARALGRLYGLRKRIWLPPERWWHRPFVAATLAALRDGGSPPVSPAEARRSLELTVALYEAAITHSVVRLPIGPDHRFYAGVDPGEFRSASGEAT